MEVNSFESCIGEAKLWQENFLERRDREGQLDHVLGNAI